MFSFDMTIVQLLAWLITVPVFLEKIGLFQRIPASIKPYVVLILNVVIAILAKGLGVLIDPAMLDQTLEQIIVALAVTAIQFILHKIELFINAKVDEAQADAAFSRRALEREGF